jgi:thiamine-phosphate pyrophosphorylase
MSAAPAGCQLYLAAPAELPPDFATTLAAVLDAVAVACVRLPALSESIELVRLAQSQAVAALLDGNAELAARIGADGVHLTDPEGYGAVRRILGEQAIVGVHCGDSRHMAMEVAEAGASYVAFTADLDLVRWWAEIMVVPVVAEIGDDLARTAEFVAAGADFICPGEGVWRDAADASTVVERLARLLD